MKNLFLIFTSGIIFGTWISWPGIISFSNWKCFQDIISKYSQNQISLKAAMAASPRFLLTGDKNDNASKLRIVGDACFR